MSKIAKKYNLNPETLMYEVSEMSLRARFIKAGIIFLASAALAVFYFWIYSSVLGFDLPKTAILKKANAAWSSRVDVLNSRLDAYESDLEALQTRNDDVYRSIFGMNDIPEEVLNAGAGGVDKYEFLDELGPNSPLLKTYRRMDDLTRKTFVQSKSFDEVANLSRRAGDMASCRPAIPPINPKQGTYRISSTYGYRTDPVYGVTKYHDGVDFSTKTGNSVYATGDGVVESVKYQIFGYGYQLVIDHGFGYKTRYAHLSVINVAEGMSVKRGDCIALTGNTGKSTGPHLHYEVIYRGKTTNPANFYDLAISPEEYASMVGQRKLENDAAKQIGFQLKTR